MYDALVGRNGVVEHKMSQSPPNVRSHWSSKMERRWNCRCTGKAASLAVTRCSACVSDVRSTDIRDSMLIETNSPPTQRRRENETSLFTAEKSSENFKNNVSTLESETRVVSTSSLKNGESSAPENNIVTSSPAVCRSECDSSVSERVGPLSPVKQRRGSGSLLPENKRSPTKPRRVSEKNITVESSLPESRIVTSSPVKHPTSPPPPPPVSLLSPLPEKCHVPGASGSGSVPGTPILHRPAVSPLALKRLRAECLASRPLSVSSIASSSSSSSSGGSSSCSNRVSAPLRSPYLASIESLEDPSETERRKSGLSPTEWFKCNDSQGSEDSGVHSSCSTSQGRPRYCDPHLSYMDRVVMEIVETEQVYVRDLQIITHGYLHHWRSQPDFPLAPRLSDLFGNLEDIYHFNSAFLQDLEQCGLDPVKVARCFVRNNAGFSVYTHYCTNYPKTVSSLTEMMRQEGTVRLFRERQTALQQTLPLGSYLLKPVQRILKYHLLLQNIVKQSVKDVVGYEDIEDALAAMTGIAQHINDMKRRHEHAVRVQEIQSLLYGWEGEDLTTFGELCAEGTFRMSGAKALRHVFLFDKVLLITKRKEDSVLGYKAHINCSNLMLIESVPGEPLSFHVIPFDNPRLQYTLQARTVEQKREWTLQIKRVILENYNAVIPIHARQLVMELGQTSKSDNDIKRTERSMPKRQHSAPEYLERRKQDRRKSDVGFRARLRRTRKSDAGCTLESQKKVSEEPEKKSTDQRRQSEPLPRTVSSFTIAAASDSSTNDTLPRSTESPDKVSIDLNNAEEVKTIEHIVGQLLMQNREFEKILKRQKLQVSLRNRRLEASDVRSETTDDEEDGIYETLMDVKLVLSNDETGAVDPDYVTLFCPNDDNTITEDVNDESSQESIALKLLEPMTSMEKMSLPTLPSVWLQQQGQHLATPSKKADSLPRSFQLNVDGANTSFKDVRCSPERPFTIASDQPNILYEGRYSRPFPLSNEVQEDDSLTDCGSTPGASLDRINLHPDYRIYRSGVSSNVLKHAISTMGSKLSNFKADLASKPLDDGKVLQWERKASRLVYLLARQCRRTLKSHLKTSNASLDVSSSTLAHSSPLPVFMQGSSNLGERLANGLSKFEKVKPKAAALLGIEPDSIISMSSSMCSVSVQDVEPQSPEMPNDNSTRSLELTCSETDVSIDSFYERSFDAMDDELMKTSAALSDQELSFTDDEKCFFESEDEAPKYPPPPPPVTECSSANSISEDLEVIVNVCGVEDEVFKRSKSIRERRKELEEWRLKEDHSTKSPEVSIYPEADGDSTRPKGWVRLVVGKLQAGDIKTETNTTHMFKT